MSYERTMQNLIKIFLKYHSKPNSFEMVLESIKIEDLIRRKLLIDISKIIH
jgi:hypothetical protein